MMRQWDQRLIDIARLGVSGRYVDLAVAGADVLALREPHMHLALVELHRLVLGQAIPRAR
jgi:aminoglycoside phosphotransferase